MQYSIDPFGTLWYVVLLCCYVDVVAVRYKEEIPRALDVVGSQRGESLLMMSSNPTLLTKVA